MWQTMRRTPTMAHRFWDKVDASRDGCWLWVGAVGTSGYGRFKTRPGHVAYAHRVAYELHHRQEIPAGTQVDHLCRVKRCVNPAHLEMVTARVNTDRRPAAQSARTHCPAGHPYTGANLAMHTDKRGYVRRYCRACQRARNDARRSRKRATQTTSV